MSSTNTCPPRSYTFNFRTYDYCGKCGVHCDSEDTNVKCTICHKIFHRSCKNISKKSFLEIGPNKSYICDECHGSILPFAFSDDIDFNSALFGEGEFPCGKCHRDCLHSTPCIQCSICETWVHYECSKLTASQFNTNPYFFCSEACEICLLPFTEIKNADLVKNGILAKNALLKPKKVKKNENAVFDPSSNLSNTPLRPKCLECNKACRKKQRFFKCHICKQMIHRKCSNLTFTELQKLCASNDPFYCQKCINENIPLQGLSNDDPNFESRASTELNLDANLLGDTEYLNNLFAPELSNNDSVADDSVENNYDESDTLPERYHSANHIALEDCNIDVSKNGDFNDKSTFSSICMNIRSLANTKHFAELQVFLKSLCFNPTVMAINETHLRDNDNGPHSNLRPDYEFISNCRKYRNKGGVGLYVLKALNFEIREDLTIMREGIFESLFIEIKGKNKSFLYGTVYRPPKDLKKTSNVDRFMDSLKKCLKIISKSKKSCIIQGDLNFNLIDTDDTSASDFADLMFDNSFFSHINKPTRITRTSATCIDHIWSNIYDQDILSGIITEKIADHMTTFQFSKLDLPILQKSEKITFEKIDNIKFAKILNDKNVDDILHSQNLDLAYSKLEKRIIEAQQNSTTIKTIHKPLNQWFDRELLQLRKKRQRFYNRFKKGKSLQHENAYKRINACYEKLVIKKKRDFLHQLLIKHKSNMRKTWGVMNNLLGRSKCSKRIHSIKVDGKLESNDSKIANGFNKFFSGLPKTFHNKLPKMNENSRLNKCLNYVKGKEILNSCFLNPTSYAEVFKIIKKLKKKSSRGLDGFSPTLLKYLPDKFIYCIVHVFNLSLMKGKFISSFKQAKVIPIHKKKSKSDMNNFRPISLLPVISKILEKIVYDRVFKFLDKNNFFYKNQFGFRPNHSTEMSANVLIDKVANALEDKSKVLTVFLDMSKAFDSVDHTILLSKLFKYGIRGKAYSWFESYLKGRKQKVCFNGALSQNFCNVDCGVPQGSILGPLLYLIYVNDFHSCLSRSSCILFADDTTLVVTAKSYEDLFQFANDDLNSLYDWLCANKLTINLDKTKYIVYSISNRTSMPSNSLSLALNGVKIKRVDQFTFLGLIIDQHLSWKAHMLKILSKIQRNLSVIRKIACFLDKDALMQLFHSLILSHIRYGITVWHHSHIGLCEKIQACVNKFFRMIFFLKPRDSTQGVMKDNNILSVNQIYHFEMAKIIQRLALNGAPEAIQSIFEQHSRLVDVNLRSGSIYLPALFSTDKGQQCITFTGPNIWNSLPIQIKKDVSHISENSNIDQADYFPMKRFIFNMRTYALNNISFQAVSDSQQTSAPRNNN